MLVVIAIIGLVAATAVPLFTVLTTAGKLGQAEDMVKGACLIARSRAIQNRAMVSVTLLEDERAIIINDYDILRNVLPIRERGEANASAPDRLIRSSGTTNHDGYYVTLTSGDGFGQQRLILRSSGSTLFVEPDWTAVGSSWSFPAAGDKYVIGGNSDTPYPCPHYPENFRMAPGDTDTILRDRRSDILRSLAVSPIRTLPEGCRFDLNDDKSDPNTATGHAWTYIFLPAGGAWTCDPAATNERGNDHWKEITYTRSGETKFSGPRIYAPQDKTNAQVIVYAMTGQAVTKE